MNKFKLILTLSIGALIYGCGGEGSEVQGGKGFATPKEIESEVLKMLQNMSDMNQETYLSYFLTEEKYEEFLNSNIDKAVDDGNSDKVKMLEDVLSDLIERSEYTGNLNSDYGKFHDMNDNYEVKWSDMTLTKSSLKRKAAKDYYGAITGRLRFEESGRPFNVKVEAIKIQDNYYLTRIKPIGA